MGGSKSVCYKHSGNAGDIIYSLAGLKAIYEKHGVPQTLYIKLDTPGYYYRGATHPTRDESGREVMMNRGMYDQLLPLLLKQEYIDTVQIWTGQKVQVDLDHIRSNFVNMPYGHIARWYSYVFPDMHIDISRKWLDYRTREDESIIGHSTSNTILIGRTSRYTNNMISFHFLKEYNTEKMAFVGTEAEHEDFCREWDIEIPHRKVNDFLELATMLGRCNFYLGNQSFIFSLAEAMKVPRILEVCQFAPNVIPTGNWGYEYYHQGALEHYFKSLYELYI